jgi:hypothetical protein
MTLEANKLAYLNHIHTMRPKLKQDSPIYTEWIESDLKFLASKSIQFCEKTIIGYTGQYWETIVANKDDYPDEYNKIHDYHPFLADFEWALNTTIKEKKYLRFTQVPIIETDVNLEATIAKRALTLSYDEAVNYMGEVAGAWILTYPVVAINKYEEQVILTQESTEEDYIYTLVRGIHIILRDL